MDIAKFVKILISLIVILSLGFWLFVWGFGYGYTYGQSKAKPIASIKTPEDVNKQLATIMNQMTMLSISGKITAISDNRIEIATPQLNNSQNTTSTPIKRTILTTASTSVKIVTPKDPSIMNKELAAFMTATQSKNTSRQPTNTIPLIMPSSYTETPAKVSDLKVGDNLEIRSTGDIRYATEITPVQIKIMK